jgi:hypothetical protein
MKRFGRYEYIFQRDQIKLTKNILPERIIGICFLSSATISAYLLSTNPMHVGRTLTSMSDKNALLGIKLLLAASQFTVGVVNTFVIQPTTLTLKKINDEIKIGSLTPIPIADLNIVVTKDIISVTVKIVDNKDEVKFTASSSRKHQLDPLIATLAELGLTIKPASEEQGA